MLNNYMRERTLTLTKKDLERIEEKLNVNNFMIENARQNIEKRQRLHELSLQQTKNWDNSIQGQRFKNLEAKKAREKLEEEQRQQLDIEEAVYQAEQRKIAIEKAKKQHFNHQDKINRFHSAVLLTEVLKEREEQIKLKQNMDSFLKEQEKHDAQKMMQDCNHYLETEKVKTLEQLQRNKQFSEALKKQIQVKLSSIEDEKKLVRIEAQSLEEETEQLRKNVLELENMKKVKTMQQKENYLKQIEMNKHKQMTELEQQEKENELIRKFALQKSKIMKSKAEKEIMLRKSKQEKSEKLIKKMMAQQNDELEDLNEQIEKAVKEKENQFLMQQKMKNEKNEEAKKSIEKFRLEQEKNRMEQYLKEKEEEFAYLLLENKKDDAKLEKEIQNKQIKQEKSKKLKEYHLNQINERQFLDKIKKEHDKEQEKRNKVMLAMEEEKFQKYANAVIENQEKRGRNVNLLKKLVAKESLLLQRNDSSVEQNIKNEKHFYKSSDLKGTNLPVFYQPTID